MAINMTMLLVFAVTILGLSWIPFLCYFAKRERIHKKIIAELTEIIGFDIRMIKQRTEAINKLGAKLAELNKSQEDKDLDPKKYN